MSDRRKPSAARFVLHTSATQEISSRISQVGTILRLEEFTVLEVPAEEDPETAWRELAQRVPGLVMDPVLIDESGAEHFPTGELMVRFSDAPEADQLADFAQTFELVIAERNPRVPAQIRFIRAPDDPRYLPDLCSAIEALETVRAAWAVTKASYKRGNRGRSSR